MFLFSSRAVLLGHSGPLAYAGTSRLSPISLNKAWHHIVELNQESRFGPEAVNNPQNIAAVEEGTGAVHRKITGFYNSKQPRITGSDTLTVRQWLNGKSFEEQYNFGLFWMNYFGGGGQINIPGITNSWAVPAALQPFEEGSDGDD